MKILFSGLVLGAIAVWIWYHTSGKIYLKETNTMTNEVVDVTETQVVPEKPVVPVEPKTPPPAIKQPRPVAPEDWSLSAPRPSSSAKKAKAVTPPAGGGVMFNDGHGRNYRIVNGRRVYY